jgi:hypothetical protein
MNALFHFIEVFMEHDQKPGQPRTFTKATFDPTDGHIVRYIRRVTGTNERLEIKVILRPVEKSDPGLAATPGNSDN